jgi:hypothetical protein
VVALEFYSDFASAGIKIDRNMVETDIDLAKENGCLYRYVKKETREVTDTYYSNDKAKNSYDRSSFCVYNKQEKDRRDNQIPRHIVEANKNTIRTEFRLYADNSEWLNWDNLRGNYANIFNRHLGYLAVLYNQMVRGCLAAKGRNNKNFKKIVKKAVEENPIRYRGKGLKKRVRLDEIKEFDRENKEAKRLEGLRKFGLFSQKKGNSEKAGKMRETMREIEKDRQKYY